MDPGVCYIKSQYLTPEIQISSVESDDQSPKSTNKRSADDLENTSITEKVPRLEKNSKNNKRGKNKNRPIYKEERASNLCNKYFNGPISDCALANCIYVHDVAEYLKQKPKDIGETCYIYSTKGFCARGLTCRFAQAHLDKNLNNMKADFYDENSKPTFYNGISLDLQMRLRKRQYDFSRSLKIVQSCERKGKMDNVHVSELNKHENENDLETITNEENMSVENLNTSLKNEEQSQKNENSKETQNKFTGCVIDEVLKGRDCQKKWVDFRNKLLLSPLTTVGNLPFRRICKEFGADITCGEMACSVPLLKGLTQEWALTKRHQSEDIFGVQLCGNSPKIITQTAQLLQDTSEIDFVDLNIGCPIDLIYQQGGGSALIRRPNVLETIIRSCSSLLDDIPFTVKTRTGVYAGKNVAHELIPKMEEWGATAVTIHGRSREQRYTKTANWEYIEKCASTVKNIPVIGNGDILNFEDYNKKKKIAPHITSVMIGRGALMKPWIFQEIKEQKHMDPSSGERFDILKKYVNYGLEHWGSDTKGVESTRRFLLEWQSFLYRYVPLSLLENPPQSINQRPQKYHGRDNLETLLCSSNCADWIRLSEMLLGPVPDGFTFLPKHKANSF